MELMKIIEKSNPTLIDSLHKKLMENINELFTSVVELHDKEKIKKILNTLVLNIIDHLKVEERLMQSLNHPNLDEHKVEHFGFLNRLLYLRKNYLEDKCAIEEAAVRDIAVWLEEHMKEMDKRSRQTGL